MKKVIFMVSLCSAVMTGCGKTENDGGVRMMTPVPFSEVKIEDSFWMPRIQSHKDVTIGICIDQIENKTGRMQNFINVAKGEGGHSGILFDDSDVYKALEGMAYSLQNCPDPELEAKCDEWIDNIAAAQLEDGYVNTFHTLTGLDGRWTDMDRHEMYCAGHMIEAAVAYYNVTGKRKFLDVCIRMADHCMSVFGPGKRDWVPGHEEIELALVKLYHTTGDRKYLEFADWLLGERGHGYGVYGSGLPCYYYQDSVPVKELTDITGHAVRLMYLCCGMADVAACTGDQGYIDALNRVWDDVVLRNMYITGGIGQSSHNEGFTEDYSLPNLTAYCETCASVGMVFWNWRMNLFTGDSKYVDVMERALYNGALAGVSLKEDKFFYVNPLESVGDHHRQEWYGCACCPSQVCRFLPSIGNYIYAVSDGAVWVNLYVGGTASFEVGKQKITLAQETEYPWDGSVKLTVSADKPVKREMRLRIPGWCHSYTVSVNGEAVSPVVEKGYAVLPGKWKNGDVISLNLDMPVEVVAADERVKEDAGMRAVQRGPVVYCLEEADNKNIDSLTLDSSTTFDVEYDASFLNGVTAISGVTGADTLKLIPYYAWDNREAGKMRVWIPFK